MKISFTACYAVFTVLFLSIGKNFKRERKIMSLKHTEKAIADL